MTMPDLLKLLDTGEHPAIGVDDETPAPEELEKLAQKPASVLSTAMAIRAHANHCSSRILLRRLVIFGALVGGVLVALNIVGPLWIKSTFEARDLRIEKLIGDKISEAIKTHKLVQASAFSNAVAAEHGRLEPMP